MKGLARFLAIESRLFFTRRGVRGILLAFSKGTRGRQRAAFDYDPTEPTATGLLARTLIYVIHLPVVSYENDTPSEGAKSDSDGLDCRRIDVGRHLIQKPTNLCQLDRPCSSLQSITHSKEGGL
jgi:hypothetical protein